MKRLTKSQYEMIAEVFHKQTKWYGDQGDFAAVRVLQDTQTEFVHEFEKYDAQFDRNKFCI